LTRVSRLLLASFLPLLLVAQAPAFLGAQAPQLHGVRRADLDTATAPGQDFYQYANGGWLKANAIPGDHATWDAFDEVEERNNAVLRQILEDAAQFQAPEGTTPRKVGDFFAAGMDTQAIEKTGLTPLRTELARLDALTDARALAGEFGRFHQVGLRAAFRFSVGQDDKDSTVSIAQLEQDGLGLPDRDYYLKDDAATRGIRAAYKDYLAGLLVLAGEQPALARAHAHLTFDLEKRLAQASMTAVERRDPQATYHKLTSAALRALAPGFNWDAYFAGIGLSAQDSLLVRQPGFLQELSAMVQDIPLAQWKIYLKVHLFDGSAPFLGAAFEQAHFAFHGTTLAGTRELGPRWKRVLRETDHALGEGLGQMYVGRTFSPRAKARAQALVANIRAALGERIRGLDWMSAPTRAAALRKLDAVMVKIGYPDHWRDYEALQVDSKGYLANVNRAAAFEFQRGLAKLGRPVDRTEWDMTPPTVNAYYNPLLNEIVFPAGILQPPFFDTRADDAVNYGAIGMVIGHELTHGFDDQGCQYDAEGNLKDWWTEADRKAYAARTDRVTRQFNLLEALPGVPLNGSLTLGENIADLGGLRIAYAALEKSMEGQPRPGPIDGFTPEQRFFLGFAQAWHALIREETARLKAVVDPHSPPRARVNAPLANLPEFAEAFGCKEEGPMNRPLALRPAIW
jgi:predicted metalloendopeptidase